MNNGEKLSISDLAKRYGRDRATITNLLKGLPFSTGKRGAHLYDASVAAAAIESVANNREGIVSEKLRQLKVQNELLELQLAKERNEVIPAQTVYELMEGSFLAIRSKIVGSHLSEAEQNAILLDLHGLRDADLCKLGRESLWKEFLSKPPVENPQAVNA